MINGFISSCFTMRGSVQRGVFRAMYIEHFGSSTGIIKAYNAISNNEVEGVSITPKMILGISPRVAEPERAIERPNSMSEYEKRMIEIAEQKAVSKAKLLEDQLEMAKFKMLKEEQERQARLELAKIEQAKADEIAREQLELAKAKQLKEEQAMREQLELAKAKQLKEEQAMKEQLELAKAKQLKEEEAMREQLELAKAKQLKEEEAMKEQLELTKAKQLKEEQAMREQLELAKAKMLKEESDRHASLEFEKAKFEKEHEFEKAKHYEMIEFKKAEAEKYRSFVREENNVNRMMYSNQRYNRYLDFKVFGNPGNQFIEHDSLVDVTTFHAYSSVGTMKNPDLGIIRSIKDKVIDILETKELVDDGLVVINKEEIGIRLVKVSDELKESLGECVTYLGELSPESPVLNSLDRLKDVITEIPAIAKRDVSRQLESTYDISKNSLKGTKNMKQASKYLHPYNRIRSRGLTTIINCYSCGLEIDLNSAETHRSHDISRKDGGDCSEDNVYLCCATCNMAMGDSVTVHEYKASLFDQAYRSVSIQTESKDEYTADSDTKIENPLFKHIESDEIDPSPKPLPHLA